MVRLREGRLGGRKTETGLDPETRKIYVTFLNSSPKVEVTRNNADFLRSFLMWLKEIGCIITAKKS